MAKGSTGRVRVVGSGQEAIGLDLSDKTGTYVVVDGRGEIEAEGKVTLTEAGLRKVFGARKPTRIALEVGTHSPWVSRALAALGHEAIVANARQLKLITQDDRKNDRRDAEMLARLARFDAALLKPIQHRGLQAQVDLAMLRSRDCLVRSRGSLINQVRGTVKAIGGRLPSGSTASFHFQAKPHIPEVLRPALQPMLDLIAQITLQIKDLSRKLERIAKERYPESAVLRQIKGVGPLTSLAYILTLEDAERFSNSRSAGAFLGMTAKKHDSGESQPQLHITRAGDELLRRLLVQSAQYILGPFGPDCDLRRWGLKLAGSANKIRKRKAIIAVARKLAVLLHRLWLTGEVYEPLRSEGQAKEVA